MRIIFVSVFGFVTLATVAIVDHLTTVYGITVTELLKAAF